MGLGERVCGVEHACLNKKNFQVKFGGLWLEIRLRRRRKLSRQEGRRVHSREGEGGQTEEEAFPDFEEFEGGEFVGGG